MTTMLIVLDTEKILQAGGDDEYNNVIDLLNDIFNSYDGFLWEDDKGVLHGDMYDRLYRPSNVQMTYIILALKMAPWFMKYCKSWTWLSDYAKYTGYNKRRVHILDLMTYEKLPVYSLRMP